MDTDSGNLRAMTSVSEKLLLRLGGVASILGFLLVIAFFNLAPSLVGFSGCNGTDTVGRCLQAVADSRASTLLGGSFGVGAAILLIVFVVMLYRSTGGGTSGVGQVGAVLGILGFLMLGLIIATSTILSTSLASLYVAASPTDKGTIAAIAVGVSSAAPGGLFEMDTLLRALGVAALGASMISSPNFGKRFGWVTVIVGLIYIPIDFGGLLFDPLFVVANMTFFPWLAILGAKMIQLSRKA